MFRSQQTNRKLQSIIQLLKQISCGRFPCHGKMTHNACASQTGVLQTAFNHDTCVIVLSTINNNYLETRKIHDHRIEYLNYVSGFGSVPTILTLCVGYVGDTEAAQAH